MQGLADLEAPLRGQGVSRLVDLRELERDDLEGMGLSPAQLDRLMPELKALPRPRQQIKRMQNVVRTMVRLKRFSEKTRRDSAMS